MKRAAAIIMLVCLALALTSCRVNWFNETVEVPWYTVAVPVTLIFVISYIAIMSQTYICPSCGCEFKPKWYQLSVLTHCCGKRLATCPNCGRKGLCAIKRTSSK